MGFRQEIPSATCTTSRRETFCWNCEADVLERIREGSVVALPLRDGRYAAMVVARVSPARGKIWGLYAYFFGPFDSQPEMKEVASILRREISIFIAKCSALGFYQGKWRLLGNIQNWRREDWPVVNSFRYDHLLQRFYLVQLDENDPFEIASEAPIDIPSAGLTSDSVFGSEAVEVHITKIARSLNSVPVGRLN